MKRFFVGVCLGFFTVALLPLAAEYSRGFYKRTEAFFSSPVASLSGVVFLRKDSHGKGYFGASRSGRRTHQGIDLAAKVGEPVFAAKSGRVVFAGEDKGYGQYIDILHPDGFTTRYAHLSALRATEGDWVKRGDTVGLAGKTGNANDPKITPHLHFEVRYEGRVLNPEVNLFDSSVKIVPSR